MFTPQRSQSGPGLSINTGAANSLAAPSSTQPASGGLFGSKPAGSLFGTTTSTASSAGTLFGTTTTSAGGSSLFGTTASAPSQAGTLFGGSATAQPLQTSSLFGNAPTTTSQPSLFGSTATAPSTTNLFGSTNTAQPQQQTSSLFGNTAQAQPQQQTTSLFGNTAQAQPQQQTTSLFGSTAQTQPQQQTTSLFGNVGQAQAQAAPSSLFGSSTAQNQPGMSLFGQPAATTGTQQPQQNTSLFGSQQAGNAFGGTQSKGFFGASQNTQGGLQQSTINPAQRTQRSIFSNTIGAYTAEQQAVPGVRINLSELRPTTRFNDLHEGVQKEIEAIDTFIYNQIKLAEECEALMPHNTNTIASIPPDVTLCERKMEILERALEADAVAIDDAKRLARKDTEAARLSFKAISSIQMPAHLQSGNLFRPGGSVSGIRDDSSSTSVDLLSYFNTQTDEMSKKLDTMKNQLGEIESYLSLVESHQVAQIQSTRLSHGRNGGVKSAEDQIKEMAGALQSFEGGILSVASRLTSTRESLGGLIMAENGRRGRR